MSDEDCFAVLVYSANGKTTRNQCKYWPKYGFVCPGHITTNGSLRMLREYIAGQIDTDYVARTRRDVPGFDCRLELPNGQPMSIELFDEITKEFCTPRP